MQRSLALAAGLLAPTAQAIELNQVLFLELNAGLYSDYRTRGISQTQNDLNYAEYHAELSAYGAFVGGNYSDDMAGDQSYLYGYAGYRAELPWELGLEARYGQVDHKDPLYFSASGGERSHHHEWEFKLSRSLLELDWSLSYVDTDLSDAECASFNGFDDVCSATLVAGVSKTF